MLTNPVLISVLVMCVLCVLKVNVMLAIIASALVGGLMAGIPLMGGDAESIMDIFIGGMGGQSETALSYVLLGALAVGIYQTGLATILAKKLEGVFGSRAKLFLVVLAVISCFSQNLIPIHIAFIPILIPPLLSMMNDLKIDRRAAACALTFGLKAPYIALPAGFGLIFHKIITDNMTLNGMDATGVAAWKYLVIPVIGMIIGLFLAIFFTYSKPRNYDNKPIAMSDDAESTIVTDHFTKEHLGALLGAITAFAIQLIVGSLPLGAFLGLVVMTAFGAIPFKKLDDTMNSGIRMMGFIAFVMLVASGYGAVIRATGGVNAIVEASVSAIGGNKLLGAIIMLFIGLIVTMGIGTSFGTIPVVATIYVPLCAALGFSVPATIVLIGVAGALGDAGSPASDSTLGPTSGLNADGQHDHIWDTCVPTFLHYNVPLIIFGTIAAMIF